MSTDLEVAGPVIPGEVVAWVDEPARRSPWARQERVGHPHPLARETYDRSLLLETAADLATWLPSFRWLAAAAGAGTLLAFSAPTWVWWAFIPAAVSWAVDFRLPRDTWTRAVQLGLTTDADEVREP